MTPEQVSPVPRGDGLTIPASIRRKPKSLSRLTASERNDLSMLIRFAIELRTKCRFLLKNDCIANPVLMQRVREMEIGLDGQILAMEAIT